MAHTFSDIVDEVYTLDLAQQQELLDILDSIVSEARKQELFNAYIVTKEEQAAGKLYKAPNASSAMSFLRND